MTAIMQIIVVGWIGFSPLFSSQLRASNSMIAPAGPSPDGSPLAVHYALPGFSSASDWKSKTLHDPYVDKPASNSAEAPQIFAYTAIIAEEPAKEVAQAEQVTPRLPEQAPIVPPRNSSVEGARPGPVVPPLLKDAEAAATAKPDEDAVRAAMMAATDAPDLDGSKEPPPGATESLRAAIIDALKHNPDIQIALARQDDAKFGVNEAWAGYLPHLDMSVSIGKELNDPYNSPGSLSNRTTLTRKEASVTLSQNVWDFGVTMNDIKRARASYRSAQWGTREKIEAITFEITTAYVNVLQNQKLVDLVKQEIAAHEKILKMVTIQNDLGLTTPADVSRAKARLENVKAEMLDRQSALQQARESYRRLTDHLPAITVDLPSPAGSIPATSAAAVAMIDDHSPRMAQAVEDRRSLERQRASQTGTFFPQIGLELQGNYKDDVQGRTRTNSDARAMVTMRYSFFNGGADIAIRNRISARLREADYELDRRRREVEQDLRIDFDSLEAARGKIITIESEIQSAQKVDELYRQQFREGRRSVFDLLDSQQILFNAKVNQITNLSAKMLSEFRVLQKLGGLFDLVSNGEPLPPLVVPAPGSPR